MLGRTRRGVGRFAAALLAAGAIFAVSAGTASALVIYNNIPNPLPGNLPSVGFEATSTSEFGGQVEFATGLLRSIARRNPTVTVTMSSWGCQTGSWYEHNCVTTPGATFAWPITLNVYEVGAENAPGSLIATDTKTFNIPYRPSADAVRCTGEQAGEWYDEAEATCYHGLDTNIQFKLHKLTLPAKAIISVAYNTTNYGPEPAKTDVGEDSLNVAVNSSYNAKGEAEPKAPSVGAYPLVEEVYANSKWLEMYCGNAGATGSFKLSGPCWKYEQPAIEVTSPLLGSLLGSLL